MPPPKLRGNKNTARAGRVPVRVKPKAPDFLYIQSAAKAQGKTQPVVAMELISEAIRARNLRAVGRDETGEAVAEIQKTAMREVMTETLAPFVEKLERILRRVDQVDARIVDEFDQARTQRKFLSLCLRFVVVEIIICRLLLRDYVHTVYKVFAEGFKGRTADIHTNFERRVEVFRGDASKELDALTELSVTNLHKIAARDGVEGAGAAEGKAGRGTTSPVRTATPSPEGTT